VRDVTWLPQKSRAKVGAGARVRLPWPSEALPKGGACDGWKEGIVIEGQKVLLDSGGIVDLPVKDFQLAVVSDIWSRRKF
jgi:hypothetical protein